MPEIATYRVDAFVDGPFTGNPAAVCVLNAWPEAALMQRIAAENNLSETAFVVAEGPHYGLRWFTPKIEVPLCGHATLAAAYVLLEHKKAVSEQVVFSTKSGDLTVRQRGDMFVMDFPALEITPCGTSEALTRALGAKPMKTLCGADYVAVFGSVAEITALRPDFEAMKSLDRNGVIATAVGEDCDFVSRFFAPAKGVNEDPVTGRAHCVLAPYWKQALGRTQMTARQLSQRGGVIECEVVGDRVHLAGRASLFFDGTIRI